MRKINSLIIYKDANDTSELGTFTIDESQLNELQKQLISESKEALIDTLNEFNRIFKQNDRIFYKIDYVVKEMRRKEIKIPKSITFLIEATYHVKVSLYHLLKNDFGKYVMSIASVCSFFAIYKTLKKQIEFMPYFEKQITQNRYRNNAIKGHAKSERQREKELIKKHWAEWRKFPAKYNGKADFARYMLKVCEHLKSTKKIEDWCREWEKEQQQE